jgi:hypothetical protein
MGVGVMVLSASAFNDIIRRVLAAPSHVVLEHRLRGETPLGTPTPNIDPVIKEGGFEFLGDMESQSPGGEDPLVRGDKVPRRISAGPGPKPGTCLSMSIEEECEEFCGGTVAKCEPSDEG